MLIKTMITVLFLAVIFGNDDSYFQQHVAYDIEVTINDSSHTLDAYEKIIWPIAYNYSFISKLGIRKSSN